MVKINSYQFLVLKDSRRDPSFKVITLKLENSQAREVGQEIWNWTR
jgi:hypothetical protein